MVVQFITQATNFRTEDTGGFQAAVPVGQRSTANPRGIYGLESVKNSSTGCKGGQSPRSIQGQPVSLHFLIQEGSVYAQ